MIICPKCHKKIYSHGYYKIHECGKPTINFENVPDNDDHYKTIGESIGKLVDKKNKTYGDSFNKSGEFLTILYPNGITPEQYPDMLGIVRVFDKLMRIANSKNAFGEDPWRDIAGYGLLRSKNETIK